MKPEEQNRMVIQQMIEVTEREGFAGQVDFLADQSVNHGMLISRSAIRAVLQDISTTFPDVRLVPLNVVAEGEWVAARCYFTGTHNGVGQHPFVHEGLLAGVPATGKRDRKSVV